jgi:hypothetical protein
MKEKIPRHWIRFGKSAETKIFKERQDTFEGMAMNANAVAHFGRALSGFIFIQARRKNFFIDPLTHAFQHPLDKICSEKGEVRPSLKKLIDIYGEPLRATLLNQTNPRPVRPDDFKPGNIEQFTQNVLAFQRNHLFNCLEDDFKAYLEEFKDMLPSSPLFLTPPYFYMNEPENESYYKKWMEINKQFVEISREITEKSENIFGQLVIDQALLLKMMGEKDLLQSFLEIYRAADGILLWVDELDEHKAFTNTLKALVYLVKSIKEKFPDKYVIALYGGYFSEMLMKTGFDGVVHGPEYGESRAVVPVGGGIPIAKYYYPSIKKRVPSNEVIPWLTHLNFSNAEAFHLNVCDCSFCKRSITGNAINDFIEIYGKTDSVEINTRWRKKIMREFPTVESSNNCLAHYLEVKKREFAQVESNDLNALIKKLTGIYEAYKKYFDTWIDETHFSHLKRWKEALENG